MSGVGGVFAGAGGGILFNVLYDMLKELISKSVIYKPLLKDILSELDYFKPLIKQIEDSNEQLGLPEEEVKNFKSHMKKGIEIVEKCSKVRKWHIYKKYKYANRLLGWDGALGRQLDILKVQEIRDVKKNLIATHSIEEGVSRIESSQISLMAGVEQIATTSGNVEKVLNEIRIDSFHIVEGIKRIESKGCVQSESEGLCEVPELPSFTVGLDVPLKELKMKLLKDDQVSMLVVTAPGGCGKTTLATKFCQDEEVKGTSLYMVCLITCLSKPVGSLSLISF